MDVGSTCHHLSLSPLLPRVHDAAGAGSGSAEDVPGPRGPPRRRHRLLRVPLLPRPPAKPAFPAAEPIARLPPEFDAFVALPSACCCAFPWTPEPGPDPAMPPEARDGEFPVPCASGGPRADTLTRSDLLPWARKSGTRTGGRATPARPARPSSRSSGSRRPIPRMAPAAALPVEGAGDHHLLAATDADGARPPAHAKNDRADRSGAPRRHSPVAASRTCMSATNSKARGSQPHPHPTSAAAVPAPAPTSAAALLPAAAGHLTRARAWPSCPTGLASALTTRPQARRAVAKDGAEAVLHQPRQTQRSARREACETRTRQSTATSFRMPIRVREREGRQEAYVWGPSESAR
uniref:Uncharacterized protein n=1 Tax=Setaria viridis TaxID=4556 RepID=A0A4U6SU83_SETVI|nr:hypothetical protein SEVIR_9G107100v2 [Setaria viridis]